MTNINIKDLGTEKFFTTSGENSQIPSLGVTIIVSVSELYTALAVELPKSKKRDEIVKRWIEIYKII